MSKDKEETQAEKEEREFEEYTAKYCTPSVCVECGMCRHCDECECLLPMSEEKRNEVIGALLKIQAILPDEIPLDDYDFAPELDAEIEKAAKKLYDSLYPKGED